MSHSKLLTAAILVFTLSALPAFAHISVKTTSIADAAVIKTLPETFSFSFSQPIRLIAFSLKNQAGESMDLGYTAPKAPAETFTVPLPDLAPGLYVIEWRTMSKDGHPMSGKSTFELK